MISRRRDVHSDRNLLVATGLGSFRGVSIPLIFGAYTSVGLNLKLNYIPALVAITPKAFLIPLVIVGLVGSLGQGTICIYGSALPTCSSRP
jgi:hypothetical protein